jgi:alpha-galactosidase
MIIDYLEVVMRFILGWITICVLGQVLAFGAEVNNEEIGRRDKWVKEHFAAVREVSTPSKLSEGPKVGLVVIVNHDPVQKNSRANNPLKLGEVEYTRGLYCHATSKVVVLLPSAGATFTSVIGVDNNDNTKGGGGSIIFSVEAGGKEVFRSDVLRGGGKPGVPIRVDLSGAKEFALNISDAGDGISCDQGDWADAKVVLADGNEIWLGDMPIIAGIGRPLYKRMVFKPPFSFVYGDRTSDELLGFWKFEETTKELDANRTRRTQTDTDPNTGLVVRCEMVEYQDFPTVEWTLYFKNTGSTDTPILENIQALDIELDRGNSSEFLLHHNVGSPANGDDYSPRETPLGSGATKRLGGAGGRPTNVDWSYFNLEWAGEGLIVSVGWPGQWAAQFIRDEGTRLRLAAGQELTHFKLLPGEEVRSPLIVLQFWKGDWIGSQNIWRRWMMAHSMPKPGGRLPKPQLLASSSRQYNEMIDANEAKQIMFINRYLEEGIKLDYWWMDAGWYVHHGGGWPRVGTWEVDTSRFPRGLRAVSDYAHGRGVKILVWFEPERVAADTWLTKNHPEWVHGGAGGGLLKLSEPEVLEWLTNHIDKILVEQGIDLYRQDFNIDPLSFWRIADNPDRQGITEIRHVTNYLAYWDELRRRHPDMLIDSCASGGRRNDLETMRRAVPLWRSDYAYEAIGHQCMTYGLSLWLPFHGTGTVATRKAPYYGSGYTPVEPYAFWSNAGPSFGCGFDMRVKELDYAALRRLFGQWRQTSANYYGDFYPLTPCSRNNTVWIAWQFDRTDVGEGMVQAFRRDENTEASKTLRLKGLEPDARYEVTNLDVGEPQQVSGRELMENGLVINIADKPGAAIVTYKKVK